MHRGCFNEWSALFRLLHHGIRVGIFVHNAQIMCFNAEIVIGCPFFFSGRPAAFPIRGWFIGLFVSLICTSLALGIGLPLILSSGRPGTYEERLLLVKKILRDVPLIDG